MAAVGLFGMKIPKEYGGLGFSVTNYARVLGFIGGYCASTVAFLSAHQSIGVPQPLQGVRHRGAEAQVPAATRARRDFGVRAHRARRRLRPGAHDDDRDAVRRRQVLHPERRQALVHERHRPEDDADRGARAHAGQGAAERQVSCRRFPASSSRRPGRASSACGARASWACAASRTASSRSRTSGCRPRT